MPAVYGGWVGFVIKVGCWGLSVEYKKDGYRQQNVRQLPQSA